MEAVGIRGGCLEPQEALKTGPEAAKLSLMLDHVKWLFFLLLGGRIRWLWSQAILNTHGVWQCWWAALLQSGAAGS